MIIFKLILIVTILLISLVIAMYSTLFERKIAGFFQDRFGPDRAGPAGIFQPLADGLKLFFKEEFMPNTADKFLYIMGPSLTMLVALLTSAIIPWGPGITIKGTLYYFQVSDINIGVLYSFAVVSVGVYGIMIGGWASNNKYALLGAIRASSQMISYELAMSLAIISVVMMVIQYLVGPKIVEWSMRVKYIKREENPRLFQMVESLSVRANIPMPRIVNR